MKNEGIIERSLQMIISISLFSSGIFLAVGIWQIILFILAGMIGIFAAISFCPLYVIIGKNKTYSNKKINRTKQ